MAVSLAFSNLAFQFNNVKVVEYPLCFGLAPTQLPYLCKERRRLPSSRTIIIPGASSVPTIEDGSQNDTDAIPTPKVIIDQDADPDATVVEITFGDRLGALLDTVWSHILAEIVMRFVFLLLLTYLFRIFRFF
ncbi:hypothetical protein IU460_29170 [Nocardia farcinica]|nr:hypothetical protein [Nocardia farcinica]